MRLDAPAVVTVGRRSSTRRKKYYPSLLFAHVVALQFGFNSACLQNASYTLATPRLAVRRFLARPRTALSRGPAFHRTHVCFYTIRHVSPRTVIVVYLFNQHRFSRTDRILYYVIVEPQTRDSLRTAIC